MKSKFIINTLPLIVMAGIGLMVSEGGREEKSAIPPSTHSPIQAYPVEEEEEEEKRPPSGDRERWQRIQRAIGVYPDGIIGGKSIEAMEKALNLPIPPKSPPQASANARKKASASGNRTRSAVVTSSRRAGGNGGSACST